MNGCLINKLIIWQARSMLYCKIDNRLRCFFSMLKLNVWIFVEFLFSFKTLVCVFCVFVFFELIRYWIFWKFLHFVCFVSNTDWGQFNCWKSVFGQKKPPIVFVLANWTRNFVSVFSIWFFYIISFIDELVFCFKCLQYCNYFWPDFFSPGRWLQGVFFSNFV